MLNIKILRKSLKENEINLLMEDIKFYPSLIYVKKSRFEKYKNAYVIEGDGQFVGICGIYEIKDWVKLGLLVF